MKTFPQRELMTQMVVLASANRQSWGKTSSNIKYYTSLCSCLPRIFALYIIIYWYSQESRKFEGKTTRCTKKKKNPQGVEGWVYDAPFP